MEENTRSGNSCDSLVVGGGIGGLTAAVYLARSGQKVLLIEKNRELGGLVNTFSSNGFQFDAGVRALLDAGIIFPMLKELNISLEVVGSPVSLGIENEVISIESLSDLRKYRELLVKFFPESIDEIDQVLKVIRKIMKHMDVLYGLENPVFKDLKNDYRFLFTQLMPWLPKFLFTVGKINGMNGPVEEYLQTLVKNPSLRDMISQHFFKSTPAFFALSYFSLYLDYFYPKGGVGKLAEALKTKFLDYGGEIRTETRISEVHPATHTVKDSHGADYHYKNLVWAADLKTLYAITKTEGLGSETLRRFEKKKAELDQCRGTDSVFSLFLEVDEPLDSFRKVAHGHFFYTPEPTGLNQTHRQELDQLLNDFKSVSKEQVLAWLDRFTRLNTYEISVPGLKDPDMVPSGKTGVIISLLAEYNLFKAVREAGWLPEFIRELEDRMISVLTEFIYPMLEGKITGRFSFSPLSIENRIGSSEGAIVGWSFEKKVPVVNKIQFSARSVLTPIPSVYQAGQWAYSPAGVPMSILTGKLAADKVIKK